ncbi:penicillinase repressor BlaI [Shouchella lehensis]|uniref:Penicillinase repressor n=1 Tax=Shouchella lehensis G1 TaxID=1246626 RepID=A0A060LP62_9BACI|nr:penicillinase repressor BlaI [Shouchella lehensis]AIC93081.1 penicillinase repressor [Shouchella lehensis G1]GAF23163.1 beta-lactamase repressor BlaI [Bacillus sp. JCM 19047]
MSKNMPSISDAEWEVMKVLWKNPPKSASQVVTELKALVDWKPKTIRTHLDRLTKKEIIKVNRDERLYTFTPLFSEDECKRAETNSFIKRVHDGTTKSMMLQFIEDETLTKEDLQELRSLLDEKLD